MIQLSPCGVFDCSSCGLHTDEKCPGCRDGNVLLEKRGLEPCGIFRCISGQKISSCGDCSSPSCGFARDTDLICPLRSKFENRRWWASKLAKAFVDRNRPQETSDGEKISDRTIDRMRWYLAALDLFVDQGVDSISSWQLAQRVGVKAPLIRKDFSRFGEFGTPSLGYDVKYLRKRILDILKLNETRHVLWLGAQKLREHMPELERVCRHNCKLVAVLDHDPAEVGLRIGDLQVLHLDDLAHVLDNLAIDLAVVALPETDAQKVTDSIARAGVTAVLNLTPTLLSVPDHVTVRNVDIGGELLALSYYCGSNDKTRHDPSTN